MFFSPFVNKQLCLNLVEDNDEEEEQKQDEQNEGAEPEDDEEREIDELIKDEEVDFGDDTRAGRYQ